MSTTDITTTAIGDLVARRPGAGAVFEQLGIDYCCGGRRTLGEACAQRGLDAATVAVLLESPPAEEPGSHGEEHDVSRASIGELCDHIVAAHHERLRDELPRVAGLMATVVRVHGADHPELHDLQRLFGHLRDELEAHLDIEERELFPACRGLEAGSADVEDAILAQLEHDHAETGDALCALRELAGGYDPGRALCGTHRRLLHALHALERELHQHLHEENNVLFARVRDRLARAA